MPPSYIRQLGNFEVVSGSGVRKFFEWLDFHDASSRLVDPLKENSEPVVIDIFVNRFPGTLPASIIIDDENAPDRKFRIKVDQRVFGLLVPVGIEPENSNGVRGFRWQGVFYFSLDEAHTISWIMRKR